MKTTYISILTLANIAFLACTCEDIPTDMMDGKGTFSLSVQTGEIQTEVITRTETQNLVNVNDFKVSLKDQAGISLIQGKPYAELSDADRTLPAGEGYRIALESCTAEEAVKANNGWGTYRFTGASTFNIITDQSTDVTINCTMQNAGLQLIFDNTFITKFPTHAATTQDARALVFKSTNSSAIAYYDVTSSTTVPISISGSAGSWADQVNITKDITLTQGKITRLTVKYDENSGNLDIDFETDTDVDEESTDVTIK